MKPQAILARVKRWDLIVVGGAALAFWLITTPSSAYFIHADTPTQDFAALAITRGCWEHITEKVFAVTLLVPFFGLFGPSPIWEMILLALAFAVSCASVYELGRLFVQAKVGGILAVLIVTALPAFQLFSHTYFGYIAPCLLLGWLAAYHSRWGWAGLAFGLAVLAHFNTLIPVGLSIVFLFIIQLRHEHWKQWILFAVGGLIPIFAAEALFFAYLGTPLQWMRDVLGVILHLSDTHATVNPDWLWVLSNVAGSNGWFLGLLLLAGLFSPFLLRANRVFWALSLTFVGIAGWYTLQAGIGRALMVSRLLASAYPFWGLSAAITIFELLRRAGNKRAIGIGLSIAGLLIINFQTGLFVREFTQTLNPQLEQWMARAAEAHYPVRYIGESWEALFFAQKYGVEILVSDPRWIEANAPGQAVLIFMGNSPPHLDQSGYTVSTATLSTGADALYPVLSNEAGIVRTAELWWPSGSSASIKPATSPDSTNAAFYYSGSGCLTPPLYGNGTMWFYQLVLHKIAGWFGLAS